MTCYSVQFAVWYFCKKTFHLVPRIFFTKLIKSEYRFYSHIGITNLHKVFQLSERRSHVHSERNITQSVLSAFFLSREHYIQTRLKHRFFDSHFIASSEIIPQSFMLLVQLNQLTRTLFLFLIFCFMIEN